MKPFAFTLVAALTAVACAACSQGPDQPPQSPTPAVAATVAVDTSERPAVDTAGVAHANALYYFDDLLKRSDFSKAFASLSGVAALPVWARQGGTATPVQTVQVEGKSMLLAAACKPHDCPAERILVLYDEHSQSIWAVFAHHPQGLSPATNPYDPANDQLTWLGAPSDDIKQLLQEKLNSPE
ncbi:Ivy family c-type lysozyme inhibitor [Dyella silvatica]|uniref:Ivy family c-type lysozyme inhibitor n=1 Tax=Dyella silvatica TaxID=2992128 RepID=UPI002251883F|nr:Ivy family c-type lysozyme inhibitor [Dyella silvatica]